MSDNRLAMLEQIHAELKSSLDLPPEVFLVIAERLESAISATAQSPLKSLSIQLGELLRKLLNSVPDEAAKASLGRFNSETVGSAAFSLGQLSFAHLLASQAAERRVDDEFLNAIRDVRYVRYIDALIHKDRTGKELAEITEDRTETVSRKLKFLRDLGITDFRREGTSLINFLTPAALSLANDFRIQQGDIESKKPKRPQLVAYENMLKPYMKTTPTFTDKKAA